jgi:hypothetical protein
VRIVSSTAIPLWLLTAFACQSQSSPIREAHADEPSATAAQPGAVAVVELFTSEGCSSCPPADAVLDDLIPARPEVRPVYALAFHVDYWDELGWVDRYASFDNTTRQQTYAHSFSTRDMYTPQMIVGGTEAFTGSDRDRADAAIGRSLAHAAAVRVSLHVQQSGQNAVSVAWSAAGAPAGSVLNIAVVERSVDVSVRAGENAGRKLHHANVVRSFVVVPISAPDGVTTVRVPASLRHDDGEVIAYAQRAAQAGGGMPILGAASAQLPE